MAAMQVVSGKTRGENLGALPRSLARAIVPDAFLTFDHEFPIQKGFSI
jgi:hypothetical protein